MQHVFMTRIVVRSIGQGLYSSNLLFTLFDNFLTKKTHLYLHDTSLLRYVNDYMTTKSFLIFLVERDWKQNGF